MVLLPDYPQKTIQAHGTRVERLTLTCTLLLIAAGGWWLTRTVEVESDALSTYGPVVILFTSALMLRDLIFFGPKERSRLTAAANISWPSILAFAGVTYGPNDQAIAAAILVLVSAFLWWFTNQQLAGAIFIGHIEEAPKKACRSRLQCQLIGAPLHTVISRLLP